MHREEVTSLINVETDQPSLDKSAGHFEKTGQSQRISTKLLEHHFGASTY
jgi:hypothetical protein